jgi:hypothetical protein
MPGERGGQCSATGECDSGLGCLGAQCQPLCIPSSDPLSDPSDAGSVAPNDAGIAELTPDGGSNMVCRTRPVQPGDGIAEILGGLCFSLAYSDTFTCSHPNDLDATSCTGAQTSYTITWLTAGDPQPLLIGQVFDQATSSETYVSQDVYGGFSIEWANGESGNCSIVNDSIQLCYSTSRLAAYCM